MTNCRAKGLCTYCKQNPSSLLDHFIPKSVTKADIFLVPACGKCNLSKSNRHPKKWYFKFFGHKEDAQKDWNSIIETTGLTESVIDEWMKPVPKAGRMVSKLPELIDSIEGLTLKTLSEQTGLNAQTLARLYRSHFSQLTNDTLITVCAALKLKSISELIEIEWERDDIEGAGA